MISIQYTFVTPAARMTFNVTGRNRKDIRATALKLSRGLGNVRAMIARPIIKEKATC